MEGVERRREEALHRQVPAGEGGLPGSRQAREARERSNEATGRRADAEVRHGVAGTIYAVSTGELV